MKQLPKTENPLVLRTDFQNDAAWKVIRAAILEPVGPEEFLANVEFCEDLEYDGLTSEGLLNLTPDDYAHPFIVVADETTMTTPGHPLLVVDLWENRGESFRSIPSGIQAIENNLTIANMNFADFVDAVDSDGIFSNFS